MLQTPTVKNKNSTKDNKSKKSSVAIIKWGILGGAAATFVGLIAYKFIG